MAGFLRVPPKTPFKKLLLGNGLWRYTYIKMSTNLKSPDIMKDAECKKGQLSQRPPIPNVPVVDVVKPKEESQVLKVKLPDESHISVPIYSCGNNKEYLVHVVAVLRIIEQKGLPKKCRVLAKAVVRGSGPEFRSIFFCCGRPKFFKALERTNKQTDRKQKEALF
jgi:hypothetical protein